MIYTFRSFAQKKAAPPDPDSQPHAVPVNCMPPEPPTTEPPTDTIEGLEQIRGEQQKTNELLTGVKSGIEISTILAESDITFPF